MATEIERKFLVKKDKLHLPEKGYSIFQGYIYSNHGRTVRIRLKNELGYITIKGSSGERGISRFEWEKEIPASEARELLQLCDPGIISKTRYEINYRGHIFEVDIFNGLNEGLIIAEIELDDENEKFDKPKWLGDEVTGDKKYYNSHLSRSPFKSWQAQKNTPSPDFT
jgi:adenylate cyclase